MQRERKQVKQLKQQKMARYKKCPNGHSYPENLSECPKCKKSKETEIFRNFGTNDDYGFLDPPVEEYIAPDPHGDDSGTTIPEPIIDTDGNGNIVEEKIQIRKAGKLVGWLVTVDGIDYRLYEGRNIIGKDINCGVCIKDSMVSDTHAVLLFRKDKFKIKDQLSTNGTYVNGIDTEDATVLLNDGDYITVGNVELLFKSALFTNQTDSESESETEQESESESDNSAYL